jgi:hypothetical protein
LNRFIVFVLCVEKHRSKKKGDKEDARIKEPDLFDDDDDDDIDSTHEGINRVSKESEVI